MEYLGFNHKNVIILKRMNIFYDYLHTTTYFMCEGAVEGRKVRREGKSMVFTAKMHHARAVGWAESISEVYVMFM